MIQTISEYEPMQHFKVSPEDLAFQNLIIAEYLTFMEVMVNSDIHLYM